MAERDEVIKDAEHAIAMLGDLEEPTPECDFIKVSFENTLALLRRQKPVKPITQDAWPNPVKVCGSCGGYITYTAGRPRFCSNCGSEMKWDE